MSIHGTAKQREMDVKIQDQTTPPSDPLFAKELSPFTIAAPTVASTVSVLEYDFTATAGHGIVITDEILLLDTASGRSIECVVIGVVGDVITIDRPIDHIFPTATTLGRIITTNMAVNGSITPQVFAIRAGNVPIDYNRFLLTMLSATSMDDGKFGSRTALTRGLVLRVVNGYQLTIFNFKTNADIKQFCYDVNYSVKAAAGTYGLSSRISFNGADKHGVPIRISGDSVLQWIVQDDLSSMIAVKASAQGSLTEGEN